MAETPATTAGIFWTRNNVAVGLDELPSVSPEHFRALCVETCARGARIAALCALPCDKGGRADEILAVLAEDSRGELGLLRTRLPEGRYPALSAALPQPQAFERELFEEHGIVPEGHPWLKPLRRHADLEGGGEAYPFFRVEGPGIHEVAVGPVHAGIIEPGHFRFQCHGETVLHLEIQLGYQHRGAEALLLESPPARRLIATESIAGDTSIGHALAHCSALEALADLEPPLPAQAIRGIALELERVANHVGDLGALCNDIGYLPGASWLGRLRGEFLNLLLELSGNRFGRGLLRPGGVRFGLEKGEELLTRLKAAERDFAEVSEIVFSDSTVGSRFEQTGIVARQVAEDLGLVGPAARASGCDRDARRDHPFGVFRFAHIPVALVESGDVMGRALLRGLETQRSLIFLEEQIAELPEGGLSAPAPPLRPDSLAVSVVEGWRGEIVHVAVTNSRGELSGYKIVDPSFHNWLGLAIAMRGNEISDFPLCNKSFNLSYAGHDL
jgi:Ni,Fe-hydrogenase III large subunit